MEEGSLIVKHPFSRIKLMVGPWYSGNKLLNHIFLYKDRYQPVFHQVLLHLDNVVCTLQPQEKLLELKTQMEELRELLCLSEKTQM